MYSYKNSPKDKIENVDLQVVIFGIQLIDLSQLFIIFSVIYYVINSLFAGIFTILAFLFFRFLEDRRAKKIPFELNIRFSSFCKKFKAFGDYFHSSSNIEFEEEVYRE